MKKQTEKNYFKIEYSFFASNEGHALLTFGKSL